MNSIIFKVLIGLIIICAFPKCTKDDNKNNPTSYEYVKYGTYFGECIGYCVNCIKISDSKIEYEKKGWNLDGSLPIITTSKTVNDDYKTSLLEKIDLEKFIQLDSIIGCPDCADGGAEWIEIKKNGKTHKVVFEYQKEPETVKSYIGYLRASMSSF